MEVLVAPSSRGGVRGDPSCSRAARGRGAPAAWGGVRLLQVAGVGRLGGIRPILLRPKPVISSALRSFRSCCAASRSSFLATDTTEAEGSSDQTEAANGGTGSESAEIGSQVASEQLKEEDAEEEHAKVRTQTEVGSQEADDLVAAVHVKFSLRQSCEFGEQFLLVGEDPELGSWNPGSAAPMEWSDGDVWTVEMDLPVGKEIKFKFILRELSGGIKWQPGPDRLLQTWDTVNTIVVTHDWENAEDQIISEEGSASLATQGEGEASEESTTVTDGEDAETQAVTSGLEIAEEETVGPAGDPVLVPGLMKTGEIDDGITEDALQLEGRRRQGALEAASEAPVEDEHEAVFRAGRQMGGTDPQGATGSTAEEAKEPAPAGGVLENDIQWGREAVQRFLANLGFYQRGST